jgi:hypothetical protein
LSIEHHQEKPDDVEKEKAGKEEKPTAKEFLEFVNGERMDRGLSIEPGPSSQTDFARWHDEAVEEVGAVKLGTAYIRFLGDDDFREAGWPLPVFRSPKIWKPRAHEKPKKKAFF